MRAFVRNIKSVSTESFFINYLDNNSKLYLGYIPCNVYPDKCFKIAEWIELIFLFCSLNIEQIDRITIAKFFIITKIGNVNSKGA